MVRAPALPVEVFHALAAGHDPERFTSDDPLLSLLGDPFVALALRVASPSIMEALSRGTVEVHGRRALRRTLLAYLSRMSTRPTPYGLFAGVALAAWGDRTELVLSGAPPRRRARPDMAWLFELCARLESDPQLRPFLRLWAHPAIVRRGDRLLIAGAAQRGAPDAPPPRSVSLRATPAALFAIDLCRGGASYRSLVEALGAAPGADAVKAAGLVDTLLESGFITSELRPVLTGSPPHRLLERWRAAAPASAEAEALRGLLEGLAAWETLTVPEALEAWPELSAAARSLVAREPVAQVDAGFGEAVQRLPRAVAREAERAAELIFRLSPLPRGSPAMVEWRRRFEDAYGTWREVPLLEVIDEDLGLGFPAWRGAAPAQPSRDRALLRLAGEAALTGARIVELDEARIAALERSLGGPGRPPRSFDLFLGVAARSAQALDDGDFLLVVGATSGVSPAGRAFGRFDHLLEAGGEALRALCADEGDALRCELLFEPARLRSANVMIRPLLSAHAVAVNGGPTEGPEVIPLDELVIGLRDDRLRLRWRRTGAEIEVSALHLLNVTIAPPLARFLYEVSHDGEAMVMGFSWGAAEGLPYRPRVQVGRVVLRCAEWAVSADLAAALAADPAGVMARWRLPRFVLVGASDERLLLDLESAAGIELLLGEARRLPRGASLSVQEALPGPEHAPAAGPDGHRLLELVVPVTLEAPRRAGPPAAVTKPVSRHDRARAPGSEWLYAKLYLHRSLADDFIGGPLLELAEALGREGLIASWFFVRYADPAFHVRLRLTGDPQRLEREVLRRITAWASQSRGRGVLDHFVFDVYEREVERYGGPEAMPWLEEIFAADSLAVARLLSWRRRARPALEWAHLTAATIDDLLDALGFAPAARASLYRRHGGGRAHAAEFRAHRPALRDLVGRLDTGAAAKSQELASILAERRAAVRPAAAALVALHAQGGLCTTRDDIAGSVVHMHVNRLQEIGATHEARSLELARRTLASLSAWPLSHKR